MLIFSLAKLSVAKVEIFAIFFAIGFLHFPESVLSAQKQKE